MTDTDLDYALRLAHDDDPTRSPAMRYDAGNHMLAALRAGKQEGPDMRALVEARRKQRVSEVERALRDRLRGTSTADMSDADRALYFNPAALRATAVEEVARMRPWLYGAPLPSGPTAALSVAPAAASARASRSTARRAEPVDRAYLAQQLVAKAGDNPDALAAALRAHYKSGAAKAWLASRMKQGATDPIAATARACMQCKPDGRAAFLSACMTAHQVGE